MKLAYLSLGSNMGRRESTLAEALRLLAAPDLRVVRVSPVYETEPMELRDQPWFLNLVAEIETDLFPRQLLARTQKIEKELGRKRKVSKGPRTIDIDILLYGSFVIDTPDLPVPHPRMAERRFVLEPLAQLAPELRHPVLRRTVSELLARTGKVEKELGRTRKVSKGPRTIDIDILLYGSFVIDTPDLQVPHPRMAERRFVLEPLAQLAPELRHPMLRRTVAELLAATREQVVRQVGVVHTSGEGLR